MSPKQDKIVHRHVRSLSWEGNLNPESFAETHPVPILRPEEVERTHRPMPDSFNTSTSSVVDPRDFINLQHELKGLPVGTDTISHPGPHGYIDSIDHLHASIIEQQSPLIAASFEQSRSGKRLHLDTLSWQTAMPFVRFLYTGSYAMSGDWEDVPTSVLLHCKMFHLGDIYDLPDLRSQAYVNVLRQCEFGCSSPDKPIELCAAIEFAYQNLPSQASITDAIVHYCVSCFLSHKLGDDAGFRDLSYRLRAFHQDLAKACMSRGFADESAAAIIQLPYKHYTPETYASIENPAIAGFQDLIHHFHSSDRFDDDSLRRKRQRVQFGKTEEPSGKFALKEEDPDIKQFSLAFRPNPAGSMPPITQQPEPDAHHSTLPIRSRPANSVATVRSIASYSNKFPSLFKRRSIDKTYGKSAPGTFSQFVRAHKDKIKKDEIKKEKSDEEWTSQTHLLAGQASKKSSVGSSDQFQLYGPAETTGSDFNPAWTFERYQAAGERRSTTGHLPDESDGESPEYEDLPPPASFEPLPASNEPLPMSQVVYDPPTARGTTTPDLGGFESDDEDSDDFSWVDVPLQGTEGAAGSNARANTRGSASGQSSDSEWDFCETRMT